MIWFQYPEVLLLAIPVGIAYTRLSRATGVTAGLRIALLVALVAALAGPRLDLGGKGIDVIVVADRSRSMPPAAQDGVLALIHDLERNRKPGDRVGVVTFGGKAQIEHPLSDNSSLGSYSKEILPDGSDLADAISTSLNLVDKHRPARILVLSDGEANGPDPLSTARRAREEGVPIDYRPFERPRLGDVAVESIQLPDSVAPREPFQFTVDIYADRDVRGQAKVFRGSTLIAKRDTDFVAGRNRLTFRDLLEQGGMQPYRVEVDVPGDPLVQNNVGSGVVFVDAGPRVLVVNGDGKEGALGAPLNRPTFPSTCRPPASRSSRPTRSIATGLSSSRTCRPRPSAACGWSIWLNSSRIWAADSCSPGGNAASASAAISRVRSTRSCRFRWS